MICKKCKMKNENDSLFCKKCGAKLIEKERFKLNKSKKGKIICGLTIVILLVIICGKITLDKLHENGYEIVLFDTDKNKDNYKGMSEKELNEILLKTVQNKEVDKCKDILDAGADYQYINEDSWTTWTKAFLSGDDRIIKLFMDKGAKLSEIQIDNNCYYDKQSLATMSKYGLNTEKTLNTALKKNGKSEKGNKLYNGFEVMEHIATADGQYITGKVKNTNDDDYSSVFININILDKQGNVIESTLDNVSNLKSGAIWSFKAYSNKQNQTNYEIMDIVGYK